MGLSSQPLAKIAHAKMNSSKRGARGRERKKRKRGERKGEFIHLGLVLPSHLRNSDHMKMKSPKGTGRHQKTPEKGRVPNATVIPGTYRRTSKCLLFFLSFFTSFYLFFSPHFHLFFLPLFSLSSLSLLSSFL